MPVLSLKAARLDIEVQPGTRTVTFTWSGSPDVSGDWVGKIRPNRKSATVVLDMVFDLTDAATGTVRVVLDDDDLQALIGDGVDDMSYWYTMQLDTVPKFDGEWTMLQKASR